MVEMNGFEKAAIDNVRHIRSAANKADKTQKCLPALIDYG